MHFKDFKNIILKLKDYDLPGHEHLLKIAPPARVKDLKTNKIPNNSKTASVLLLFYPDKNSETRLVMILRNIYNGVHSNQISFPGGKVENQDKTLLDTALRETEEEIGVSKKQINYVGSLSSVYIPPSNFNVYPYIGFCDNKPNFSIDKKEVSMVLEPTLASLLEMKITESIVTVNKTIQKVPSYLINDHVLWGATAIMVHEFIILYKQMINS